MGRLRRQIAITLVLGAITTIGVAWTAMARTWLSTGVVANAATPKATAQPLMSIVKPDLSKTWSTSGVVERAWISGSLRTGNVQQCISWTTASEERGQIQAWIANSTTLVRVSTFLPQTNAPPPFWSIPRRDFDAADPADGHAFYDEVASGWPLPALRLTRRVCVDGGQTTITTTGLLRTPAWARGFVKAHDLPYAPILVGFAADTLLFAAGWFVLLFGYSTVRRWTRHAAGHCHKCGYNLRGDLAGGCPECGWNRTPAPINAGSVARR